MEGAQETQCIGAPADPDQAPCLGCFVRKHAYGDDAGQVIDQLQVRPCSWYLHRGAALNQ